MKTFLSGIALVNVRPAEMVYSISDTVLVIQQGKPFFFPPIVQKYTVLHVHLSTVNILFQQNLPLKAPKCTCIWTYLDNHGLSIFY